MQLVLIRSTVEHQPVVTQRQLEEDCSLCSEEIAAHVVELGVSSLLRFADHGSQRVEIQQNGGRAVGQRDSDVEHLVEQIALAKARTLGAETLARLIFAEPDADLHSIHCGTGPIPKSQA